MLRPWWLGVTLLGLLAALPGPAAACTTTQAPSNGDHFLFDLQDNGVGFATVDSGIDAAHHRQPRCVSMSATASEPDPSPTTDGRWFEWRGFLYDLPSRTAYFNDGTLHALPTQTHLLVQRWADVWAIQPDEGSKDFVADSQPGGWSLAGDGGPVLWRTLEPDQLGPSKVDVLDGERGWLLRGRDFRQMVGPYQGATVASAKGDWVLFRAWGSSGASDFVALELGPGHRQVVQAPAGASAATLAGDEVLFTHADGVNATYVSLRDGSNRSTALAQATPAHVYGIALRVGPPTGQLAWPTTDLRTMEPLGASSSSTTCSCSPTYNQDTTTTTWPPTSGPASGTGESQQDGVLTIPSPWWLASVGVAAAAWAIRRRL